MTVIFVTTTGLREVLTVNSIAVRLDCQYSKCTKGEFDTTDLEQRFCCESHRQMHYQQNRPFHGGVNINVLQAR